MFDGKHLAGHQGPQLIATGAVECPMTCLSCGSQRLGKI